MKKFKKYLFLILIIVVASLLCIYGFTFAKYVSNSAWDYYLKSKGFYFSSDYLDSNTIKNVNNLWDGGSIHFNIKNNLNDTVITNYDIGYRATCTVKGDAATYTACYLNGTSSNTQDGVLSSVQVCHNHTTDGIDVSSYNQAACTSGGYDWVNQVATKDLYFDVVLTDNNYELKDVVINITVASTYPYRKTLSGDFTLHKSDISENEVTMTYTSFSNYDRLTISNAYTTAKCVSVTWNADKFLINADSSEFSSYETDTNGYINEIKFNINAKASSSYIFYKKDFNATYDVAEFQLQETSGC